MLMDAARVKSATTLGASPKPIYEKITRALNVMIALVGLLVLAPLMVVIAIAIKLSAWHAPVLYRGERVGKDKQRFNILKFRTMAPGTENQLGAQLIAKDSTRITRLGGLLRRRKLDELPQLINVLRGDMNLVGPRPVRPVFLNELEERIPHYDSRFAVPPGLTGLAQVEGGYYTDPRDKLRFEQLYIKHRSVLFDFKLIAATGLILAHRLLSVLTLLTLLVSASVYALSSILPVWAIPIRGWRLNLSPLLVAGIAAGLVVSALRRRSFRLRRTSADPYIIYFIAWGIIGAIINTGTWSNLGGLTYFTAGAFLLYYAAAQAAESDFRMTLYGLRLLAVGAIGLSVYTIVAYTTSLWTHDKGFAMSVVHYRHSGLLGLLLPLAAPALLYLSDVATSVRQRQLWEVGIWLAVAALLVTASARHLVPFAIGILIFFSRRQRTQFLPNLVAGAALLMVLSSGTIFPSRDRGLPTGDAPELKQTYNEALSALGGHALLGMSWLDWSPIRDDAPQKASAEKSPAIVGVADSYTAFVMQHGLVGLFFCLLIVAAVLKDIDRATRQAQDPNLKMALWAIFSGVVGFMFAMLFFNCFKIVGVYSLFWLLLGLGSGLALEQDHVRQRFYRLKGFSH